LSERERDQGCDPGTFKDKQRERETKVQFHFGLPGGFH
jgi:hypothetical protein